MEKKTESHKREITYHNKDVLSKILAENFKDKSLQVYGINIPKIKQILPTNLPEIQINELRLDNLFLLEDGSVALIDYESEVKWTNHLKYLNYIVRILGRYKKEDMPTQIRMIVIYTADIEEASDEFSVGCLTLKLEQAFLSKIDSAKIHKQIKEKLENNLPLSDNELMKLIILPLTYKGKKRKKQAVEDAVILAKQITDANVKSFVLSGILVFADKIIDTDTSEQIKEVMHMTRIEQYLVEEYGKEYNEKHKAESINILIDSLSSLSIPDETIAEQLVKRYLLTEEEANTFIQKNKSNV